MERRAKTVEGNQTTPDQLTVPEEIAVEYADIMQRLIDLNKRVISELAQYRRMDEEEKELEALIIKMGGGRHGN